METNVEDNSSISKCNEKIKRVLQKFLDPKFKISNDVYLNSFMSHLVGKNGEDKIWEKNEQLKEHFCQWVIDASTLWDRQKVNPPAQILSFALNLAGELSADDHIFVKLNCQDVYERLVGLAQKYSKKDPSVTLGMVSMLCSFLEHKSGLQWVMATTHWTDIINLGLKAQTMYIRKKASQLVIQLLDKTVCFNRNFVVSVVDILIKPLKDVFRTLPSEKSTKCTQIESKELFKSLRPSLDMILEINETLLKKGNKKVLQLFFEMGTSEAIKNVLLVSQDEEFSFKLLQIQFVFLFYQLDAKLDGVKVVAYNLFSLVEIKLMFDLITYEMEKLNVKCVVKICDYAHGLFCCLATCMPVFIQKDMIVEFQIQLMFIQMIPIFILSNEMITEEKVARLMASDILRNEFFNKCLRVTAVPSIKLCYKWAEKLQGKPDLVDDVIFCLQYVIKMKKLLNKDRATIVFPVLVYCLSDALTYLKENPKVEFEQSCFQFVNTLIDTVVDIVESFDLTWRDSIQTICVMDLAFDFLGYQNWNNNLVIIKGLKLLNTAISKYMSPDMVLLIYSKEDSKVSQTGSLLYAKCHDSCWEIRDSALEVVYTLSRNANTKFPALTNILLNAELPQLVFHMAFKDGEYYVRATAFRCLQELIQIPEIWSVLLNIDEFLNNILDVFEKETEGIVRKEAAALIHRIDKFQHIPDELLPRVYDVMTHAAIGDLYWEVKCNALDFWFNLWEQHLVQQGMIDRTFPSHTFSMEHKKIVALTEAEVRKRIIKVLNQLSHIGFLHVIKCAVQDDCDVEVSKKATSFTFCMLKTFQNYKVSSENVITSQPSSPEVIQKSLPNPVIQPIENLFSNSPFFDPVSPYQPPHSPSQDLNPIISPSSTVLQTSTFQYCPEQNQIPHEHSVHQQEVPDQDTIISQTFQYCPEPNQIPYENSVCQQEVLVENTLSSLAQLETALNGTPTSQITSSENITNEMDVLGLGEASFDVAKLTSIVCSNMFDPVQTDLMLDEFLNSTDIALLEKIYNPTDEVTNNTIQMKKKMYLSPSEYLKFVYNEVETHAIGKTQWLNSLDEFDSLLDDILKEYNVVGDINSMDCY